MNEAKNRSSKQKGKQKPSQETKPRSARSRRKTIKEDSTDRLNFGNYSQEDIAEVKKLKVLTPFAVASRLNIKISAAKKLLQMLEKNKIILQIASGPNIKIYKLKK
jgi:small subunit ribosomal protein S25e